MPTRNDEHEFDITAFRRVASRQPSARRLRADRSGNEAHRASPYRDACFIREILARNGSAATGLSVCVGAPLPLSALSLPSSLPSPTTARRPLRRWHDRYRAPTIIAHRVPPTWREASIYLRAEFAFLALQQLGPVAGFTLNLSPEIEAQARAKASPLDWLHRRIRRELKAALGRPVAFMAAIEETDDHLRRLHLHGVLQLDASNELEAACARKALRRAGGEWEHTRNKQAHIQTGIDAGWISYMLKGAWKATPFMRETLGGSSLRVRFRGALLSATSDIWTLARADDLWKR